MGNFGQIKMNYFRIFLFVPFLIFSQPFVTAELQGQLGNQMFIIAAAVSLALDCNAEPIFPDLMTQTKWNVPLNREKVFFRVNSSFATENLQYSYHEPYFHFHPIPNYQNMILHGNFQSEKYFRRHKREICDLFAPSQEIVEYLEGRYADIIHASNTVGVHLRTYEIEPYLPSRSLHLTYGVDYFEKAMALFPEETLFVVFSNEMEWCKKELSDVNRKIYFVEGESHYHDFYLMSLCKDQIISNSSYSWWAAYLNKNPNKRVVAPGIWFNPAQIADTYDLYQEDWIVIR